MSAFYHVAMSARAGEVGERHGLFSAEQVSRWLMRAQGQGGLGDE